MDRRAKGTARHTLVGRRLALLGALAVVLALAFFVLQLHWSGGASASAYSVTTDQEVYSAGDLVTITGAGYVAGGSYDVVVVRPDGSIVNASGVPGFDTVTADTLGNITDLYTLTLDAPAGVYVVEVFDSADTAHSVPLALTSFYDDTPYPLTITQSSAGLTVTVSGTWKWNGCISHSNSKKHVGFAIVWGDGTGIANPSPPPVQSRDGVYPTSGPAGTWTACAPPGTGSWGPISHTFTTAANYQVCVITYDVNFRTSPSATSINPWQNSDNSYSMYSSYPNQQQKCASANLAPTPTPTATPNSHPSAFATPNHPVGIWATTTQLLVTTPYCGDPHQVLSIDSSGNSSVYANLPSTGGGCVEDYLAISPGLGGFSAGDTFVTQGNTIYRIPPGGSPVTPFVTISSLGATHLGITFDAVGTFGFKMIVTGRMSSGSSAQVWTVDASAGTSLVATIPSPFTPFDLEGPDVAPASLPQFAGQLFVASEQTGKVYAVSPAGAISTVASITNAEPVNFVPSSPCTYASSGGTYFVTLSDLNTVDKFPLSDFSGLSGDLLVADEYTGGISRVHITASSVTVLPFNSGLASIEGATFVHCGGGSGTPTPTATATRTKTPTATS
ncbi:MAG TPA: hypothetical protein VEZ14_03900, partial [Dehalococcoidia bacterium]|nr:hypothetical protein [Dehalococcoidia bacterium]